MLLERGLTRRSALSFGVSAAAAFLSSAVDGAAWAQASGGASAIIDVHHHVSPPEFVSALVKHRLGERPMLDWTPARSIEDMDRAGVALSLTSITTPGVWFGDREEARLLARVCNDYGAKLKGISQDGLGCSPRCRCLTSMTAWMRSNTPSTT